MASSSGWSLHHPHAAEEYVIARWLSELLELAVHIAIAVRRVDVGMSTVSFHATNTKGL